MNLMSRNLRAEGMAGMQSALRLDGLEPAWLGRPCGRTARCRPAGRLRKAAGLWKFLCVKWQWPNHAKWRRGPPALARAAALAALVSDRIWLKTQMFRIWKPALALVFVFLLQSKFPAACALSAAWTSCSKSAKPRRFAILLKPAGGRLCLLQNSVKPRPGALVFALVWPAFGLARPLGG